MATDSVTLSNGCKMPLVGLGTWQVTSPEESKAAVRAALEAGYRHIDTAFFYGNEAHIGEVLQEYFQAGKLKREDVFITTKLSVSHHHTHNVPVSLEESLQRLRLDYVDLFLIHFPTAMKAKETPAPDDPFPLEPDDVTLEDTWRGMEQVARDGKTKSIGVSNFNKRQLERVLAVAEIKPVANQVESHLYFQQSKLMTFMKERGITLIAYSPFGSPDRPAFSKRSEDPIVLEDQVARSIADHHKKTTAQVLLRFMIQRGIPVIPKSTNSKRIQENIQVFDFNLSDEEMSSLVARDKNYRLLASDIFKCHPEYPFHDEY